MGFTFTPSTISFAGVNVVAGATTYPTVGAAPIVWPAAPATNINFPKANCRQIVILNTGATTLYFGSIFVRTFADLPSPFNPASGPIVPAVSANCTIIPGGASLSIALEPFEKRGQFDPGNVTITAATFEPLTLIYFAAPGAGAGTATLTYINTTGPF